MDNLSKQQASILAKAIAEAWDELPPTEEQEFGTKTEAKAAQALTLALKNVDVIDSGIMLDDDAHSDLLGQFQVYLQGADTWGDISRMEAELAELFSAA